MDDSSSESATSQDARLQPLSEDNINEGSREAPTDGGSGALLQPN